MVKVGEKIQQGQIIAKLGNTGNSSAPHLHMHVTDHPDPLKSQGVPFVFKRIKMQGTAELISIEYGAWKWDKNLENTYAVYESIIPTNSQVFDFSTG